MYSVSIIIVTYNSENEIKDCLYSVINALTDFDYQIIIVDNNSIDNTKSIVDNFSQENIYFIKNKKNLGYTKAINQCLKIASKDFILFLNPDTVINDSIINLFEELNQDQSIGAIAPQLIFPDGIIQRSCRRFPRRRDIIYESIGLSKIFRHSHEFNGWKMGDFDHKVNQLVDQPAGAAILMKKEGINKIGLLDERFPMFFSDVDYCYRIKNTGYNIKFSTGSSIIHKAGASVYRKRSIMIVSSHLSFWKYFQKYRNNIFDDLLNIMIGTILLIIIPFRIIFNLLFSKLIRHNRTTL